MQATRQVGYMMRASWPCCHTWACMQEVAAARDRVTEARAAVRSGEAALAALETGIPRAQLEATAHTDRARDLASRLSQLEAATQVHEPYCAAGGLHAGMCNEGRDADSVGCQWCFSYCTSHAV